MKKVVDMCPFMGLTWEDEESNLHYKGQSLTHSEKQRLDIYFAKFVGKPFDRAKSKELAQLALDNQPIPKGWQTKER